MKTLWNKFLGILFLLIVIGVIMLVPFSIDRTMKRVELEGFEAGKNGIPSTANPFSGAIDYPWRNYKSTWARAWVKGKNLND